MLAPGTRVVHATYGPGTVIERTGHTHEAYTRILLDRDGRNRRVLTARLRVEMEES